MRRWSSWTSQSVYMPTSVAHTCRRLIECIDRPGPQPTVLDYAQGILERLRGAVPGAASWSVDARATIVLSHDGGFKPIEEICRIEAAERTEATWGAAFKVCLACPQAQSAIAFDRDDMDNVGEHPSHNQVCDLEITVTGDLTTVAGSFRGRPARCWRVRGQRAGAGTA